MTASATPARSFDAWALEYDLYRPGYPDALFFGIATRLSLPPSPRVADLGAGTGRATLAMAARGWRVTAIEPGKPMLDILRAQAADAGLVVATVQAHAEDTGLNPASADLATAAQAFHWFDKPRAVAEMARIVRPGGGVALFWNVRDESRSPFVANYHALLERTFGSADTGRYIQAGRATGRELTGAAFAGVDAFADVELSLLMHELSVTAEQFMGMAFTASYVRALPGGAQETFRAELAEVLERHGLADGHPFVVPYRIDLWTATRTGG